MKKIILLAHFLISINAFSQTLTLYCKGLEENYYEQNPQLDESHKDTREYKFIDGKYKGKFRVQWSSDSINYDCSYGNGCGDESKGSGAKVELNRFEISRNSGEVTEYASVRFDRKIINASDTKSKFKGICTKVESKKF